MKINGEKNSRLVDSGKARVLVVDCHPILRQGLADLLNRQQDLVCCGEVDDLPALLKAVASRPIGLVITGLRLASSCGFSAIKALKTKFPNLRILILSKFDELACAERALRAGASGYVMKSQSETEVLVAIRTVLADHIYVNPRISMLALARVRSAKQVSDGACLKALSDRERFVFNAMGAGRSTKEIAGELNLSVKTIESHRENLKHKLGFATGAELTGYARSAVTSEVPI